MTYCVIDLETNGTKTQKRFCNPLDVDHSIELACWVSSYNKSYLGVQCLWGDEREIIVESVLEEPPTVIVGQNLKFDLLWLWDQTELREYFKQGGKVWDTLTVQYLLDGQLPISRHLDDLAIKYGGEVKDNRIKDDYYSKGLQSKDVPKEMLLEYCKGDVSNTELIFLGQVERATDLGMMDLIEAYMMHYIAIIEMEFNGLHVDTPIAFKELNKLCVAKEELAVSLTEQAVTLGWPRDFYFNPDSEKHLNALLFGGEIKEKHRDMMLDAGGQPVVFKSGQRKGQVRLKWEVKNFMVLGTTLDPLGVVGKSGLYSVDGEHLTKLQKQQESELFKSFFTGVLSYRHYGKLISTYYIDQKGKKEVGNLSLINPTTKCIHTEFNTARTVTGRLSSKHPNIQNLDPSCCNMFTSRFKDGKIIIIDFSQLEVCIQAVLSESAVFIADIAKGVDFHCLRLAYAEEQEYEVVYDLCVIQKIPEWVLKRKKAKIISFQKAYGAFPARIAEETGLSVAIVEKVFKTEEDRYPEVKVFNDKNQLEVQHTAIPTNLILPIKIKHNDGGYHIDKQHDTTRRIGYITSPFMKRYGLYDYATRQKNGGLWRYYKSTQVQNYPIQGTAADLVSLFVGGVYVNVLADRRQDVLLVNEIHDSIVLDCKAEHVQDVCDKLEQCANDLPDWVLLQFNYQWPLEFKVDVKVLDSMGSD